MTWYYQKDFDKIINKNFYLEKLKNLYTNFIVFGMIVDELISLH